MIKVLIVDDSLVARDFLVHILTSDPGIEVVGVAENGLQAIDAIRQKRPDVITMDIHMPQMDGYAATRRIMETQPTPIVIVSGSTSAGDVKFTFRAIEAGALAVILRPPGIGHPDYEAGARELIQAVKLMSEIRVVRRHPRTVRGGAPSLPPVTPAPKTAPGIQILAIGASTGGPPVLQKILSGLPRDLTVPVLIVQHIAPGFIPGFVEWLSAASRLPVHIAVNGELPLPGHGYVAPQGFHLGLRAGPRIVLSGQEPENGLRPSVSHLFRSVAEVLGPHAVGVLLTGMGKDGAEELKTMKDRGAITIAQDETSSVVHGMPGEAIRLGGATHILPPEDIASFLAELLRRDNRRPQ